MGAHAHRHLTSVPTEFPTRPPRATLPAPVLPTPDRSTAALLLAIAPVHTERLEALRRLQEMLTRDRRFATVLVEHRGYPALSLSRMDGRGSMMLGCAYSGERGEWWHVEIRRDSSQRWIAPVREPAKTAYAAVSDLLGGEL